MTKNEADALRDALIKRVTKFLVEVEEIGDEIRTAHAEDPKRWTEFDERRNTMALRTVEHQLMDMTDRLLLQVGRWDEIMKPGAKWDEIKARIKRK